MSIFDLMDAGGQDSDAGISKSTAPSFSSSASAASSPTATCAENKEKKDEKERALQETMVEIKKKYGKNAVVKVKNLKSGGTAIERNNQIGGHKA